MKSYDNLVEAIADLKERGYRYDFNLKPHCLECPSLKIQINPEQFEVDEVHRIEGDSSSPDSNSVIYAISSSDGVKGILVDAYGPYSEAMNAAMVKKLKMHD